MKKQLETVLNSKQIGISTAKGFERGSSARKYRKTKSYQIASKTSKFEQNFVTAHRSWMSNIWAVKNKLGFRLTATEKKKLETVLATIYAQKTYVRASSISWHEVVGFALKK